MHHLRCVSGAVAAILMVATATVAQAQRQTVVDCNDGDSLEDALNNPGPGGGSTIFFTGECVEDVTIRRDLITLNGDPNGTGLRGGEGTVNGQITVQGADNVTLEFLTVTGSGVGIFITDGGDGDIIQVVADGNEFEGVGLTNAAVARIIDTDITNNANFNFGFGLVVQRNSAVELRCGNVITGNGADNGVAIWMEEMGALRQQRCDAPGAVRDVIQARPASEVSNSKALVAFNGSTMDIRGANVLGPIDIHGTATFRVQRSDIQGDINNTVNSLVGFRPNVTFTGTLTCDATSEIFGPLVGLNSVQCGQTCSGAVPGTCAP